MPDYLVTIDGKDFTISVNGNEILVNGKPTQVELKQLNESGLHLLLQGQENIELVLNDQSEEQLELSLKGQRVMAQVMTPSSLSRAQKSRVEETAVKAPMPGMVIEIQCQIGDEVEKGQVLIIVESMKMQMQLRSPIEAKISAIPIEVGQRVEKGDLLVKFDLSDPSM